MSNSSVATFLHPLMFSVRTLLTRLGDGAVALAPRIRVAIAGQQDESERLIGWFQLAIVAIFGVLFAMAPKQLPLPLWDRAAAWVIAAYLLFTFLRLALSYRGRLPGWLLAMSVIADIGLLMFLIWSFHIEYGQPPSFSLKAPTLLYVFIFIALRALRFDARYVILAGATAAVGWALMIAYAATYAVAADGGTAITRNYVTYLTSNSILLGAEFDKIISILVVTAVLAAVIVRARSLLIKSASEQAASGALARFFSPEVANRIRSSMHEIRAGEGQLRSAAILTTDVRGFTSLAMSMLPNEVISLLIEYQRRIVPIVQRHGGMIDKFIGDGILATFCGAEPSDAYAADALRAAQEIGTSTEAWAQERSARGESLIFVGTAVAAGRVIFGAIGDQSRLEFTVIGDAVNLAAKLEKHTKAERVRALTTDETYALALDQGFVPSHALERRPLRRIEGLATPIDLVVLA